MSNHGGKAIGVIIMTLSSIFSASSPGLQFAHSDMVPYGHQRIYGVATLEAGSSGTAGVAKTASVSSAASRTVGLTVKLALNHLVVGDRYQALLGYGNPDGKGMVTARVLGSWLADRTIEKETFKLASVRAIPEIGWSLIIRRQTADLVGKAGAIVAIPHSAIAAAATFSLPAASARIMKSAVLGPYLLVFTLGARLPMITQAQERKRVIGDEYVPVHAGSQQTHLALHDGKHPVDLRVRLHIFNLASGVVVTSLHPVIRIYRVKTGQAIVLNKLSHIYSSLIGRPDFQYAGDVFLPVGSYRATVAIGSKDVVFTGVNVTSTTALALNPSAMSPSVVVKEHNGRFYPAVVHVLVGDKIEFVFDGEGADKVVINGLSSPMLLTGQSWSVNLLHPGVYRAYLEYAKGVRMKVVVNARD